MMEIVSGSEQLSQRYALSDHGDFLRLQWPPGARIEAEGIRSSISAVKSGHISIMRTVWAAD